MKKIIFFILFPLFSFGQIQIGNDVPYHGEDVSMVTTCLSGDGNTIAIGNPSYTAVGNYSGQVRTYKKISGSWTQIGNAINGDNSFSFSGCVALSNDGTTLAIGTPKINTYQNTTIPYVRIYNLIGNDWVQIGNTILGEQIYDGTGTGISLSADGMTVALSAPKNNQIFQRLGRVRVYHNEAGVWTLVGSDLIPDHLQTLNRISLSADGSRIAISYMHYVRVFKNNQGSWTQEGGNIFETLNQGYDTRVSLSADGSVLAIGVPEYNSNQITSSGLVKVYRYSSGSWIQIGSDIYGFYDYDNTGHCISLSADGSILAVSDPDNDVEGSGLVRVFKNITEDWSLITAIYGNNTIDVFGNRDYFGHKNVTLSADGTVLGVGAIRNMRIYDISPSALSSYAFTQEKFILYPNPAKSILNISLNENILLKKVSVYNTLGQLIKTENKKEINVSNLSKGSYFIEVCTDKGKATKSFIVE